MTWPEAFFGFFVIIGFVVFIGFCTDSIHINIGGRGR